MGITRLEVRMGRRRGECSEHVTFADERKVSGLISAHTAAANDKCDSPL